MQLSVKETHTITPTPAVPINECSVRDLDLGNFLKQKRKEKHLTVRQLAAKAKISYSELSKIENGKTATPSTLRKLSPYLSLPIETLLSTAGFSFKVDTDSPTYLDLEGNRINLKEHALKLYSRDVELFFHLDDWINDSSNEDVELLLQFLCILKQKQALELEQKTQIKTGFFKIFNGLQALIQALSADNKNSYERSESDGV